MEQLMRRKRRMLGTPQELFSGSLSFIGMAFPQEQSPGDSSERERLRDVPRAVPSNLIDTDFILAETGKAVSLKV
jgi:hypothetical protein